MDIRKIVSNSFLLVIILFKISSVFCQKSELTINIVDRVGEKKIFFDDIYLFRNNQIFDTLEPDYNGKIKIKIPKGNYTLKYTTIFNLLEEEKIEVEVNKDYNIDLKIYKLNHSETGKKALFDLLQEDQQLKLYHHSMGCFHSTYDTIIIAKKDNKYFLIWDNKSKVMSEDDIIDFREFEIELQSLGNGFCTTNDEYIFEIEGKQILFNDRTCDWYGYKVLFEKLFHE